MGLFDRTAFRRSLEPFYDDLEGLLGSTLGFAGMSRKIWWVHSGTGVNDENHGTFDAPWASMDYANQAIIDDGGANRGDLVFVKAGHTETVTAAAGLDMDAAGVTWIGLGRGSNRPTINFTTVVGADMDIDAANIAMVNFLFTGGIDALTGPIDVNAADFALLNSEYRDVTGQATDVIVADANADRLLIAGWFHNGAAAAGANSAIALIGMDNPVIRDFRIIGNFAVSAIDCRTTAVVDLDIRRGYIWTKNAADLCIKDTITGSTGRIGPDLEMMLTDNAANITEAVTGATFHLFDPVYVCNLAGEKAMLINWVASTDA
jgi:hypothetical protein